MFFLLCVSRRDRQKQSKVLTSSPPRLPFFSWRLSPFFSHPGESRVFLLLLLVSLTAVVRICLEGLRLPCAFDEILQLFGVSSCKSSEFSPLLVLELKQDRSRDRYRWRKQEKQSLKIERKKEEETKEGREQRAYTAIHEERER